MNLDQTTTGAHLQRAMVAVKLANLGEGRPGKTTPIGGVSISQSDAAKALGVGTMTVSRACVRAASSFY
jgi:hypothetical protein